MAVRREEVVVVKNVMRLLQQFDRSLVILLGSLTLTAILVNVGFNLIEAKLYDLRMAWGLSVKPSPEIVLVAIDQATTKAFDEMSPLPLNLHARLMERLESLRPRAVGYLVDFSKVAQINSDQFVKKEAPGAGAHTAHFQDG